MKGWINWSGLVSCTPRQIYYPESVEEVRQLVKKAKQEKKTVRVVGSGHSFTPLVKTDQWLVSLDRLQGVKEIDTTKQIATIWAGTKLYQLGQWLSELGFAQENLGDINAQSVAGAISTGTHGSGMQFGSVSTQLKALTMVTGNGDVISCSDEENPMLFKAAQVSLGALGIIVEVKLKVIPKYRLHYRSYRMSLDQCLQRLNTFVQENRHFEFFWFPHTDQVQVKIMNQTDQPPTKNSIWNQTNKLVIENGAFWCLSEAVRLFPRLSRSVSRISAKAVPTFEEINEGYLLFATPRLVRFYEMEYSIQAEKMAEAIKEIQSCIQKFNFAVHFPIECRYVKGDDIWLSSAYGRNSAYIAIHMYKGMPYQDYFIQVEEILKRFQGRPHWGKMHTMKVRELIECYPMWSEFLRVRSELDPDGIFLNTYLRQLFGLEAQ
jgi:FAD-linked oxidoreductase